jgi:Carboxypeptidase regulatory-like domain
MHLKHINSLVGSMLAIVAAFMVTLCSPSVVAQSGAGSIQGTVSDSTDAMIPGASIHVVNQATGVASDTKTNAVGFYQVPGLFAGTYAVTVSASNMKTYTQVIELQVAQVGVINAKMSTGSVTQQVKVAGNAIQLTDTTSGTLAETLDNQRINQLPMNGRYLINLVTESTPGVEPYCCNNESRANGLMAEAMEYETNGVPENDLNFGGQSEGNNAGQSLLPDPDAVQEVHVVDADGSAAYDTPATAVITTKSGTNQLHGTFFETMRNNAVGIAKERENLANYVAPPLVRNEFGASAGGPIILPHVYHGKDKSFWFFAYERYSLAETTTSGGLVPTTAERNGDFSGMINSSGVLQTIYDPSTTSPSSTCVNNVGTVGSGNWCRTQYDYNGKPNTINPNLISPLTKILYAMTPPPTTTEDPLVNDNITIPDKQYQVTPTIDFRLDHVFNENNKAFLYYQSNNQQDIGLRTAASPATDAADGFPAGVSGVSNSPDSNYAASLNYTHIFSPTFFSQTNVSQQWYDWDSGELYNGTDDATLLGTPNNFGATGFPSIGGQNTMNYGGSMYNYQENQVVTQIDEDLTKTVGRHQMEFGVRLRQSRQYYLNSRNANSVSFEGGQTTGLENWTTARTANSAWANTGLADADFFIGGAYAYSVQLEPPPTWFLDQEYDAYFQDNWHVRRNLTLNLGVRYQAEPARRTRNDVNMTMDLKNQAIVLGAPIANLESEGWTTSAIISNMEAIGVKFENAAEAGMPSTLFDGSDLNFLPRVGFAWQMFGNKWGTVLRGGYGQFTDTMPNRSFNPGPTGLPFAYSYTQNYSSAAQTPDSLPNYNLRSAQNSSIPWSPVSPSGTGTPVAGINADVINTNVTSVSTSGAILPGFGLTAGDPDRKPDFARETNLTVEQPFKGGSALRVSWVWTHGSNLDNPYYMNYSPSAYVWETNTGTLPPNGGASTIGTDQYASTALGPWNNITYGAFNWSEKTGYSNENDLQVNYQHQFSHGYAWQVQYVWARAFRFGDNSTRDSIVYPTQDYATNSSAVTTTTSPAGESPITPGALPPARPAGIASYADWHGLNTFEQYILDDGLPQQHLQLNYIFDLPFGRGKWLLGNANGFVNELVGGWQVAGDGQIISQDFQPAAGNWGPVSPLKIYKKSRPKITDCSSGVCHPMYLWFNGYISPKYLTPGEGGTCTSNCVEGLPSDYIPYETPIDNNPALANFGTNDVLVSSPAILAANGGNPETVSYSPGPAGANRYSHTTIRGPVNYNYDVSLYKVFPIRERMSFRVNLDAFNAFNQQGLEDPGTGGDSNTTNGEVATQPGVTGGADSYWTPRQLQLTMRFTF